MNPIRIVRWNKLSRITLKVAKFAKVSSFKVDQKIAIPSFSFFIRSHLNVRRTILALSER